MKTRMLIGIICLFIIATFDSCIYSDPFIWVDPMRCIRGEIIDFDTKKPLSGIEITTPKKDNIVHSDSVGMFHIHLSTKTEYTLIINSTSDNGYSQKDTVIPDSLYQGEKIIIYLNELKVES